LTPGVSGDARLPYPVDVGDAGQIHNAADALPAARTRSTLLPAEEALSLPSPAFTPDPALQLLGRLMGARLCTDNLAWRGNPVAVMRSLQKRLVEHALNLPEDRREPAMRAIRTVELAVAWRLRWLQMKRSDAESQLIQPQQEDHATSPIE